MLYRGMRAARRGVLFRWLLLSGGEEVSHLRWGEGLLPVERLYWGIRWHWIWGYAYGSGCYATNRAEATSSLSRSSARYSFSTPYEATSLKSSTAPVALPTGAAAPSATVSDSTDDTVSAGPVIGVSSAESVSVSGTGILAAVLAAAVGGLAFGL